MSAAPVHPDWIAVDWGTTHLRAWAMGPKGALLGEASSGDGMGGLSRDGFEPALLRLIGPWLAPDRVTEIIACGMVGSRQGWHEAPYRAVPCRPVVAGEMVRVPTTDARIAVRVLPGLKRAKPADVMRGEETQIAGFLALEPGFDGVMCLPGTHTKWVQISADEVVSFQTFMTGELFGLLSTQSVLRHGLAGEGWDEAGFADAVSDAISRPERIAARLFGLRAEALLGGLTPDLARARLSGFLIGLELAGARPYWLGQDVVVLGAEGLAAAYLSALSAQGLGPRLIDVDAMTRAGLAVACASERTGT